MRLRISLSAPVRLATAVVVPGVVALFLTPAIAQPSGVFGRSVPYELDAGPLDNDTDETVLVFQGTVEVEEAAWIRLAFSRVRLGSGSYLKISSLLDGAEQHLDSTVLEQWANTSAFFNGSAVRIELFAGPRTTANSAAMEQVMIGEGIVSVRSICGPTDDRVRSSQDAVARMLTSSLTSGCTATIYSTGGCMVTAGHCTSQPVIQFNVPPSLPSGALQHPPPSDQYVMDASTLLFANGGIGNDWGVFECFPNTETGLTVYEAQQAFFPIAADLPTLPADMLMYGYGSDSGVDNQVQQLSEGPIVLLSGTVIRHQADSTGGSSGSAILNAATTEIIAIHTNAGCDTVGYNSGTNISNGGFQSAYPCNLLAISYPEGLAEVVHPATGATMSVMIAAGDGTPDPNTAELLVQIDGGGYTAYPLTYFGGDLYDAQFPPAPCGSLIDYYVSIETLGGEVVTDPASAPTVTYTAVAAVSLNTIVALDFETSPGWSVSGDAADGQWSRGVPVGGGDRGDPPSDYDASGQCWLTDNVDGNSDVDGGTTILTSAAFDVAGLDVPLVRYARWYSNNVGAAPESDIFVVEVSDNDGASWVELETVGPSGAEVRGGWFVMTFRISDFVTPTNRLRLRYLASDLGEGSVVEAAVDAFEIFDPKCLPPEPGDFDGDGDVDLDDFGSFAACYNGSSRPPAGTCPPGVDADLDNDGDVDLDDFSFFADAYTGSL